MRLSTKGRYAVMAMVDLAQHAGEGPVCLSDIADRQEISLSYLEQLFAKLRVAGLVKSVRGPGGGYLLTGDGRTEREIQGALAAASRNRTTLVIAHRLATVVDAHEILVLDRGVIAERGRHRDLLASGGRYAAMWNKQEQAAAARDRLEAVKSDPDIHPGLQPDAAAN